MGKDRDIIMTVACITPPVPALCKYTRSQELQIQFVFLLHIGKVTSSCFVDVYKAAVGGAREVGEEMARAVVADHVQYLQKICVRIKWHPAYG